MAEKETFLNLSPEAWKAISSAVGAVATVIGAFCLKWAKRISDRRTTDTKSLRLTAFQSRRCCEEQGKMLAEIARVLAICDGLKAENLSCNHQVDYLCKMFPDFKVPDFDAQIKKEIAAAHKTASELTDSQPEESE